MASGINTGLSRLGVAPQNQGQAQAAPGQAQGQEQAAGGAGLPSLATGQSAAGSAPVDPATQGAAAQAGGAAAAGASANPLAALGTVPSWVGPLTTVAGGGAAIAGFSKAAAAGGKGFGLLKFGGIAAALAGVGITYFASKQAGATAKEAEILPQFDAYNTQVKAKVSAMQQDYKATIDQLQQKIDQGGAGGQAGQTTTDPATGQPVPGGQTGDAGATGSTGSTGPTIPSGTTVDLPGATTTGTVAAGQWTPASLVGSTVDLTRGKDASGRQIVTPGTYRFAQAVGDVNGYASLDEANAAVRSTMSTETMGAPFLRFMVVEHGGRFYAAIAKSLGEGEQPKPLAADAGNVVGWNALSYDATTGADGWKAYSWTKTAGESTVDVGYAAKPFAAGGAGTTPASTTTPGTGSTAGTATSNVPAAPGSVTGGGATAARSPFDTASAIGRSFSVNASTTAEGTIVRGGALQVQGFVASSTGGFGTAEEAAVAARQVSKSFAGDAWKRAVTLQGSDGRFYVYTGSIVARETAALDKAAPVHVFGSGFAEYYDGASTAWKALRDAA